MHQDDTAEIAGTLKTFSLIGVFADADIVVKLTMILALGAAVIAVIAAIARRTSGGPRSSLLALMGQIGLYAGIAGAGYSAMTAYMGAQAMHTTRFAVLLPSLVEAACVLLLGLIAYAIARFGNAAAKRT